MIGNKLEQSIISVFQNNPSKTFSINEIAKQLKKSYPIINLKSNFFLKEGILRKINIGRSYQCFLNLENEKTKVLMAINEINNRETFLEQNKDFEMVRGKAQKLCEKENVKGKIISILVYSKNIIFLLEELEPSLIQEFQTSIMIPGRYKSVFLTAQLFKEEFANNIEMQKNHVVLLDVNSYINILRDIANKLLIKGMLVDVGTEKISTNSSRDIIKKRDHKNE